MHENPMKNENGEIVKAGCLVVNDKGEILLIHNQAKDIWGLPKGHMEQGESPLETATRETREETGLTVTISGGLDDLQYVDGHGRPVRIHYFLANPQASIGDGEHEQRWATFDDAISVVLPHVKGYLERIRPDIETKL